MPVLPEIVLEAASLSPDGRGVGRCHDPAHPAWDNMTVFARGVLPGETARVRIARIGKNFAEGESVGRIAPAPDAVLPFCPSQGQCGGCPLQGLSYPAQLKFKGRLARDALTRIGRLDTNFVADIFEEPLPSPHLRAFRNKMEFAFGRNGQLTLGLRKAGSLEVVPLAGCPLLPEGHEAILQKTLELARGSGLPAFAPSRGGYWRHLALRATNDGWIALCVTSPGRKQARILGERLLADVPQVKGFIHEERKSDDLWRLADKRVFALGQTVAAQEIGGRNFRLDAASFCQVNPGAANILAGLARELAAGCPDGALLDLYCGIGAPGQLLAPLFKTVLGVDSQKVSIEMAKQNAADLGNCAYMGANADNFLRKNAAAWHTILADPPRFGLGAGAAGNILRLNPAEIIYISCNPATLARDAAILAQNYELARLASIDMFPHTAHLECISRWRRK